MDEPAERRLSCAEYLQLNPVVVIEVRSPGTESWDRGEKLRHCMSVPTLRDADCAPPTGPVPRRHAAVAAGAAAVGSACAPRVAVCRVPAPESP